MCQHTKLSAKHRFLNTLDATFSINWRKKLELFVQLQVEQELSKYLVSKCVPKYNIKPWGMFSPCLLLVYVTVGCIQCIQKSMVQKILLYFINRIAPNSTNEKNQKLCPAFTLYALCCMPFSSAYIQQHKSCQWNVDEIEPRFLCLGIDIFSASPFLTGV